jgi:hypothetical protein
MTDKTDDIIGDEFLNAEILAGLQRGWPALKLAGVDIRAAVDFLEKSLARMLRAETEG